METSLGLIQAFGFGIIIALVAAVLFVMFVLAHELRALAPSGLSHAPPSLFSGYKCTTGKALREVQSSPFLEVFGESGEICPSVLSHTRPLKWRWQVW